MNLQNQISVVLGSLNRFEYLKATIFTIREELKDIPDSEVIVIDGGSTDGSVEWLTKQKDIIFILQHNHGTWNNKPIKKQNWGYYMNLGFKSARYKYILMVSDDCLLVKNSIINGINQINECEEKNIKIGGLAFLWRHWPDWDKYGVALFYNKTHLNHGIFLKEALERVGYVDDINYTFYAADVDLSFKLHDAGFPIIMANNSYLEHHNHVSQSYKKQNYSRQEKEEEVLVDKWSKVWGKEYFEKNIRWRREVVEFIDIHETYKIFEAIDKKKVNSDYLSSLIKKFR